MRAAIALSLSGTAALHVATPTKAAIEVASPAWGADFWPDEWKMKYESPVLVASGPEAKLYEAFDVCAQRTVDLMYMTPQADRQRPIHVGTDCLMSVDAEGTWTTACDDARRSFLEAHLDPMNVSSLANAYNAATKAHMFQANPWIQKVFGVQKFEKHSMVIMEDMHMSLGEWAHNTFTKQDLAKLLRDALQPIMELEYQGMVVPTFNPYAAIELTPPCANSVTDDHCVAKFGGMGLQDLCYTGETQHPMRKCDQVPFAYSPEFQPPEFLSSAPSTASMSFAVGKVFGSLAASIGGQTDVLDEVTSALSSTDADSRMTPDEAVNALDLYLGGPRGHVPYTTPLPDTCIDNRLWEE